MTEFTRRNLIKSASVAPLGSLFGIDAAAAQRAPLATSAPGFQPARSQPAKRAKSKRDLMLEVLNMEAKPGYIPAAFFMHFGVKGDAAVRAHLDYFRGTGMDFVKIQFDEQTLPSNDQIKTPQDWSKIPVLPEKWFEPSLYLLKSLIKEAKSEALIIQTLYSPYQMAKQAVPWNVLVEHVKQDAESVCRGMENITLSILHFVQAAARLGVDGFYACTQGGETNRVADHALFNRTIKNYDMLLYKEAAQLVRYNIMHVCDYDGSYANFNLRFQDYPGQVVNVPLMADNKPLSLRQAAAIFRRPVMGGLNRLGIVSTGSPDEVKKAALEALKDAPANVILGADCTVNSKTPIENLRMAIRTAHEYRV
jgi:uroporphyrinogen decarboxylase